MRIFRIIVEMAHFYHMIGDQGNALSAFQRAHNTDCTNPNGMDSYASLLAQVCLCVYLQKLANFYTFITLKNKNLGPKEERARNIGGYHADMLFGNLRGLRLFGQSSTSNHRGASICPQSRYFDGSLSWSATDRGASFKGPCFA